MAGAPSFYMQDGIEGLVIPDQLKLRFLCMDFSMYMYGINGKNIRQYFRHNASGNYCKLIMGHFVKLTPFSGGSGGRLGWFFLACQFENGYEPAFSRTLNP